MTNQRPSKTRMEDYETILKNIAAIKSATTIVAIVSIQEDLDHIIDDFMEDDDYLCAIVEKDIKDYQAYVKRTFPFYNFPPQFVICVPLLDEYIAAKNKTIELLELENKSLSMDLDEANSIDDKIKDLLSGRVTNSD